jgi:hypothetical protein
VFGFSTFMVNKPLGKWKRSILSYMDLLREAGLALPQAIPRHLFDVQVARIYLPSTRFLCGTSLNPEVLPGTPLLQPVVNKHAFTSRKNTVPLFDDFCLGGVTLPQPKLPRGSPQSSGGMVDDERRPPQIGTDPGDILR